MKHRAEWTEAFEKRAAKERLAFEQRHAREPSKYKAEKTNGYSSKKESKRAVELRLMERAGDITNLREQVRFELIPAQYVDGRCVERACSYVSDFTFNDKEGQLVVIDVKGFRTPVYRLKRKLMLLIHGIAVVES